MGKKTKQPNHDIEKRTVQQINSTNNTKQIWVFSSVDSDGDFAFNPICERFCAMTVVEGVLNYSRKTWQEVIQESYGKKGKKKHHHLSYEKISEAGVERIKRLQLEDDIDALFSMRLNGKTRVIGFRDGQHFIVKWFDPDHEFCPCND